MIRFKRLSPALLNSWLVGQQLPNSQSTQYRLRLWREDPNGLAAIKGELIDYLDEAFDDARIRLRKGFEDSLSPFTNSSPDPAANYPAMLHQVTLQNQRGQLRITRIKGVSIEMLYSSTNDFIAAIGCIGGAR